MPRRRRIFQRPLGKRRYRTLFVIATEGDRTEPQYFGMFNTAETFVHVECLRSRHESTPAQVLTRMKNYIQDKGLKPGDEAWLVVDKDQWSDEQLAELHQWSTTKGSYGLAVSNPKFEYWLLLHFEDGDGISSPQDCMRRLSRHLPGYDKGRLAVARISPGIASAVERARRKDTPACLDWPRAVGTTVYRLVEKLC